jgi:hypothetical protein
MAIATLSAAPCGNERPNCRILAAGGTPRKMLCNIHSAWCPDDYHPQPTWNERRYTEQRSFRTGG